MKGDYMANEILKKALQLSMERELETIPSNASLNDYHVFSVC